ncbi:MAG: hypothetical protein AAGC66_08610 [Leifsonia sp.]
MKTKLMRSRIAGIAATAAVAAGIGLFSAVPAQATPIEYGITNYCPIPSGNFTFKNASTGSYMSARLDNAGTPVIAGNNQTFASTWDEFTLSLVGSNSYKTSSTECTYALKASNGKYVSAAPDGSRLVADRTAASTWELFSLVNNGGQSRSLLAKSNGKLVQVQPDGNTLAATGTNTGSPSAQFSLGGKAAWYTPY